MTEQQLWPTSSWPTSSPSSDVDTERLTTLLANGFGPTPDENLSQMLSVGIVHRGQLVAEEYGPTADASTALVSWSMGKSVTQALVGCLVAEGKLDLDTPAPVAAWANDDRSAITLRHLLSMTSGLRFAEDYVDDQVSDVIEMLFGSGKADAAGYASSLPLDHAPGSVFNYSSGTTNIISRICSDVIGGGEAGTRAYLQERIFGPLGMTSADPRFDEAGTFIGSSFLYCTTQDFLRFGYLYLHEGVWDGQQILPVGWAEMARTPVPVDVPEDFGYGSHWWLWDIPEGGYGAHGYEGQYILVVPGRDLVITRLGKTPAERKLFVTTWLSDLADCFPAS